MHSCKNCGFPFEPSKTPICPKCQIDGDKDGYRQILEVDVAHSGETWEMAKDKIIRSLDQAIYQRSKGLRIIHGYGSLGNEAVIAPRAISLMRHLAEQNDARFAKDAKNPGVSIIWLNRSRTKAQSAADSANLQLPKASSEPLCKNWFEQAMSKKH